MFTTRQDFWFLKKASQIQLLKADIFSGCAGCLPTLGLIRLSVLSLTQVCWCGGIEYMVPTASWGCIPSLQYPESLQAPALHCTVWWEMGTSGGRGSTCCTLFWGNAMRAFCWKCEVCAKCYHCHSKRGLLWYSHLCFNVWLLWKLRNAILSTIRGHLWIISFSRCARRNAKEVLITMYVSKKVSWE